MRTFASSIAVAVFALSLATSAAFAQNNRSWVRPGFSNVPCTFDSPCATFQEALSKTNPGGEINCLDSSEFITGGIIAKSVTIDCGGNLGGINGAGFIINGANIVVKLRNLTFNGLGSGNWGVLIQDASAVIIENCVIQGFNGSGGTGIFVQTSSALKLNVSDTLIADNTDGTNNAGILIAPTGSGATTFALERVRIEDNARGGFAVNTSGTGAVTGVIRDSVITGNGQWGVFVNSNTAQVTVSLEHTQVSGNALGITAANGVAVILNNSTIQTNNTAFSAISGSAIFSYGNNAINGNQPGGTGTAPISIGLR
jgi:hypothetical protein